MITIELKDDRVTAALGRLEGLIEDLSPVMNEIGDFLAETSMQRIDSQVSPDGSPFAPRSAATLARYERQKLKPKGVLHLSGRMRSGIFHTYGRDFAEVSSNEPQAAVMQFGAAQGAFGAHIGKDKLGRDHFHSIPWGNIPARPFLGVSDDDATGIAAIVGEWLGRALTGST